VDGARGLTPQKHKFGTMAMWLRLYGGYWQYSPMDGGGSIPTEKICLDPEKQACKS